LKDPINRDSQNQSSDPSLDGEQSLALAQWIAQTLDRKGGQDIVVLETRPGTYVADYLVLATGTSGRHMNTLLDAPCQELRKLGFPANHVEGEDSHWMLADLGDVVIHIFDEQSRENFDIESLWKAAPRIDWLAKSRDSRIQALPSRP